jgi:hypothetical protein
MRKEELSMLLTAVDSILTVTRDDLPPWVLTPWTQAVSVAAAAARKQGNPPPEGLTEILSKLGWVIQSASERSVELMGLRNVMSQPEVPLLDSFLDFLETAVPADAASLLDWWWSNACDVPQGPVACVAVLDLSGKETMVDLRSVSLPEPAWRWLARAPSLRAGVTRTRFVLNTAIYKEIERTLEQKSSGLTDHVRTMLVVTGNR